MMFILITTPLRGFVKLKKFQKSEEKLGLSRPRPPTRLSNFLIFFGNMYNEKNNTKTQYLKKKRAGV